MPVFSNGITNMFKSPAPGSVNGDKESRGKKRKAKGDPYENIDDGDSAQKKSSTPRTKSRISSETPGSSVTKGRPSSSGRAGANRASRSKGSRKSDAVDAVANLARAQEPQAARLQPQPQSQPQPQPRPDGDYTKSSLIPVANMGDPELPVDDDADAPAPAGPSHIEPKPADKTPADADAKGKTIDAKPQVNEAQKKQSDIDQREEHEIQALLKHRMTKDGSGIVQLLVHWAGETEEQATWEFEEEIQRGAEDTVYEYWKAQGGRLNTLFIKPNNPPPEIYHVYNILRHEKRARGGFEFEVQWVGHPATRGETTMEAEVKLKKIAPKAIDEYWEGVGGREKFLAKRGRNKKQRTE
ncbi:hypothetical protein GGR54DRAFT_640978 [Hypoxylon sp. NC1633]|nr:hypothetical protein GGR54DRAFT_640978 [Hypoxylon sp. NC1633]